MTTVASLSELLRLGENDTSLVAKWDEDDEWEGRPRRRGWNAADGGWDDDDEEDDDDDDDLWDDPDDEDFEGDEDEDDDGVDGE